MTARVEREAAVSVLELKAIDYALIDGEAREPLHARLEKIVAPASFVVDDESLTERAHQVAEVATSLGRTVEPRGHLQDHERGEAGDRHALGRPG